MKCSCVDGLVWDNVNEILLGWETRTPCEREATFQYESTMKIPLCEVHKVSFEIPNLIGKVEKIE
jgi:hypothetical protein